MPAPAADRNLLFGILALQMDFIKKDALIQAMQTWVFDKGKPLGDILAQRGSLRPEHRLLLEGLVEAHLKQHDNDAQKSLAALSSIGSAREELKQVADADVQASLVQVSAARPGDEFATRAQSVGESTSAGVRFRILRPHARGGLGEVFVAEDAELHREVALKEIQDRHADDPNSRSRFVLEAEITGGLEHPGIVPVYGLGQYADGRPFYAMRFIRGDSLKDAIERYHSQAHGQRSVGDPGERAVQFRKLLGRFLDVCNAIAYAHSRGVLHRDLKPGNIMLGKYGETLVVDWGLAKSVGAKEQTQADEAPLQPSMQSGTAETVAGSALGTPQFMSPEQAAGRIDLLGPASDVYSLGATLYVLLTGKPAFTDPDVGMVLQKVQRGDFPPPRQVQRDAPKALEAICLKAMALKPAARYATPRALAEDVEHWLADELVTVYREPLPARLGRWARRHRTTVTAALAALLVGLAGLGTATVLLTAANERARDAKQQAEANEIEAGKQRDEAQLQRDEARKQRDRALANYRLASDTIAHFKNRLEESPEFQATAMAGIRMQLLNELFTYYQRLVKDSAANDPALEAERARGYQNMGGAFFMLGQLPEAEKALQSAIAIQKELGAAHANDPELLHDLSASQGMLASLYTGTGRHVEADKALQAALAIQQPLAASHPAVPKYQQELAHLYRKQAIQLRTKRQFAAALKAQQASLDIQKTLSAAHPSVLEYQKDLAFSYDNLASVYAEDGKKPEAEKAHRESLAIWTGLRAARPNVVDYQLGLGRCHALLADLYSAMGKMAEAEKAYQEAIAVQKPLADAYTTVAVHQQHLGKSLAGLATLYQQLGKWEQAADNFRAALTAYNRIRNTLANNPQAAEGLRSLYISHAKALEKLGKSSDAIDDWKQAAELGPGTNPALWAASLARAGNYAQAVAEADRLSGMANDGLSLANLACVFSLASAGALKDVKLPEVERVELAEKYAVQAMALLTRARSTAFFKNPANVKVVKQTTALDPIRQREDFKKFFADLEQKAKAPPDAKE